MLHKRRISSGAARLLVLRACWERGEHPEVSLICGPEYFFLGPVAWGSSGPRDGWCFARGHFIATAGQSGSHSRAAPAAIQASWPSHLGSSSSSESREPFKPED